MFILNNQGLGINGQTVVIKANGPLNIAEVQPATDSLGKAIFDVTCANPGDYTVSAEVGGVSLQQRASIVFE